MFFKILMAVMILWLVGSAVLKRRATTEAMRENPSRNQASVRYGFGWLHVEGSRAKSARNTTLLWVFGGLVVLTVLALLGPSVFPGSFRH
jgi:hypothetical protein